MAIRTPCTTLLLGLSFWMSPCLDLNAQIKTIHLKLHFESTSVNPEYFQDLSVCVRTLESDGCSFETNRSEFDFPAIPGSGHRYVVEVSIRRYPLLVRVFDAGSETQELFIPARGAALVPRRAYSVTGSFRGGRAVTVDNPIWIRVFHPASGIVVTDVRATSDSFRIEGINRGRYLLVLLPRIREESIITREFFVDDSNVSLGQIEVGDVGRPR